MGLEQSKQWESQECPGAWMMQGLVATIRTLALTLSPHAVFHKILLAAGVRTG